jgi:hypothetical protein
VNPAIDRATTGEELKLELFANRTDVPIEYSWVVAKAPEGSNATVLASRGKTAVTVPGTFQYAYAADGNNVAPTFMPDMPGNYELKLVAKLTFADLHGCVHGDGPGPVVGRWLHRGRWQGARALGPARCARLRGHAPSAQLRPVSAEVLRGKRTSTGLSQKLRLGKIE